MPELILFVTGRLARNRLEKLLSGMNPGEFTWEVREVGVKVAALMTTEILRRRLPRPLAADRVILPGRFRGDLEALGAEFGMVFQRGPDELKDLPVLLHIHRVPCRHGRELPGTRFPRTGHREASGENGPG